MVHAGKNKCYEINTAFQNKFQIIGPLNAPLFLPVLKKGR